MQFEEARRADEIVTHPTCAGKRTLTRSTGKASTCSTPTCWYMGSCFLLTGRLVVVNFLLGWCVGVFLFCLLAGPLVCLLDDSLCVSGSQRSLALFCKVSDEFLRSFFSFPLHPFLFCPPHYFSVCQRTPSLSATLGTTRFNVVKVTRATLRLTNVG